MGIYPIQFFQNTNNESNNFIRTKAGTMLKIQYCSDLHLEFASNYRFLLSNKLTPKADILVLAGDITLFGKNFEADSYFDFLSQSFQRVFWVPGNHEYYKVDINSYAFNEFAIRENFHIVNNKVIENDGVSIIFTTLWGKISPQQEENIRRNLNDFSLITIEGEAFCPMHFNLLHQQSLDFLNDSFKSLNAKKSIVVTHHVPTFMNYPKVYVKSPLNEAFAVELLDLIEEYQPEAWIYGHTHYNTPEFCIGKTRLLTNQLGYVDMGEHKTFSTNKVLTL